MSVRHDYIRPLHLATCQAYSSLFEFAGFIKQRSMHRRGSYPSEYCSKSLAKGPAILTSKSPLSILRISPHKTRPMNGTIIHGRDASPGLKPLGAMH